MKIAIDTTPTIYKGSGVATYYNNLIPELLNSRTQHEFILFGYSLRKRNNIKHATKTFPFPPTLMKILWNNWGLIPLEKLIGECDVYHAWDYIQAPTKAKLVVTIHDLTPLLFPQYHTQTTVSNYKSVLKRIKKNASAIIADSENTKKDLIRLYKINPEKIHVIYLAASHKYREFHLKSDREKQSAIQWVKRKYNIDRNYILFIGTKEPRKNLHKLIKAYQLLKPDALLILAGKIGWGKQVVPSEGVRNIGFIPEIDLPALYAGSLCFVYPSLYEGFGLPVLEAMSVGCPVVTTKMGSLSEIAGEAAVFVNPEKVEAISSGINTALNKKEELSKLGIEQARKFSWKKTAAETLTVYESLLGD